MTADELLAVLHGALAEREQTVIAATLEVERCRRAIEALTGPVAVFTSAASGPPPVPQNLPAAASKPVRPAKPPARKSSRPGESKYDYAAVAIAANDARNAGKPMAGYVAKIFGVSAAMGSQLILTARRRGHDIPGKNGAPKLRSVPDAGTSDGPESRHPSTADDPAPPAPGLHFECLECPESEFATTRELAHHTITSHDRPPKADERIGLPA